MVEISDHPVVLKEDDVELELGLSIGGSFRRSETVKPSSERAFDSRRNDSGFDLDLRENDTSSFRSAEPDDAVDSKTKRDINALRRREARKNQREKRCRSATDSPAADSVASHATESDDRRRQQQRAIKRGKTESHIDPVQYPHASVQLVPITRGLAYPCVNLIPYWTASFPAQLGGGAENSAFRAVPCGGFRPFLAHPSFGLNVSHRNGEAVAKTTSDHGSPMCSSSTVSDHQSRSSSLEGDGSSNDTRTQNSSQSSREQNQPKDHNNNNKKLQSEVQSGCNNEDQRKAVPPTPTQVSPQPCLTRNTNSNKETRPIDIGKPPRPQCHNNNNNNAAKPITPQMPYVSARGDGPEGKTVTGLLYRYSDSEEVIIVCVCHGTAFSPAEFVRHAGGADVSHPLRHITVLPSAF